MNKYLKYVSYICFSLLLFLGTAIYFSFASKHIQAGNQRLSQFECDMVDYFASLPSYFKYIFSFDNKTIVEIKDENYKNCIDINNLPNHPIDSGYLLVSTYSKVHNQATVKLIDLEKSKVIHEWIPPLEEMGKLINYNFKHFNLNKIHTDPNFFHLCHPYINTNGELQIYTNCGPLITLDLNSKIIKIDTSNYYHHILNVDEDGNKYFSIFETKSNFYTKLYKNLFTNDAILITDKNDKILFKKNIFDLLEENNLIGSILGVEALNRDPLHLNSCNPVKYSSAYWKKGDVIISLRNKSLLILYRPSTNKAIWYKQGPWINQHSPVFVSEKEIVCLSNNYIRGYGKEIENSILRYNFETNITDTIIKLPIEYSTKEAGQVQVMENQKFLIDVTYKGIIICYDKSNAKWKLINKIDDSKYGMFFWSRFYHKNELQKFLIENKK